MNELPPATRLGAIDPDALARDDAMARPLGGRVERTGLGLVRIGETVVPKADSAARLVETALGVAPAVTIEVAVTVEVGPSADQITEDAAELALRRLREALHARTIG
ncbi:hypothetical protein [Micromonospora sp. NPDC049679]|uniref:hypothetical protein n=1 Tax=Micromonospora sp. NPDC049679 TaxID=3155920 RepID=UPI00340E7027